MFHVSIREVEVRARYLGSGASGRVPYTRPTSPSRRASARGGRRNQCGGSSPRGRIGRTHGPSARRASPTAHPVGHGHHVGELRRAFSIRWGFLGSALAFALPAAGSRPWARPAARPPLRHDRRNGYPGRGPPGAGTRPSRGRRIALGTSSGLRGRCRRGRRRRASVADEDGLADRCRRRRHGRRPLLRQLASPPLGRLLLRVTAGSPRPRRPRRPGRRPRRDSRGDPDRLPGGHPT